MLAGASLPEASLTKWLARTDLLRSRVLQEHSLPEHGNRKPKWGLSREQGPFSAGQIERWFGACAAHFLEG